MTAASAPCRRHELTRIARAPARTKATPPSGAQMPSGGALPEAAVTAIKTWIDQGAAQ
jgi:hypothetical protein